VAIPDERENYFPFSRRTLSPGWKILDFPVGSFFIVFHSKSLSFGSLALTNIEAAKILASKSLNKF
jgi:hypothetical protein